MGSLMAGWDSHVQDPKALKYMRNKSLTKEEIEAYWKSKKKTEEEHLKAISSTTTSVSNTTNSTAEVRIIAEESADKQLGYRRTNSLPVVNISKGHLEKESDADLEKLLKKNCWWTSSNWAFLNEPPVIATAGDGRGYKYASQHQVASSLASPKPDTRIAGV
ncbi:hypothetical protein Ancab_016258 [Ancistrocladus abbreviatus]